jgi:anaerobic magnesium-protoporphyrin IX monomethyl ester cyclase
MISKILFVEPPKDYWFIMGEYLPPPTGLLILAAYIEKELPELEVEVYDAQALKSSWKDMERYIETSEPSIVAASGFTCNAYACARVVEIAKRVNDEIITVLGGLHFSFMPEESLNDYHEIDYIVRGEGEITFIDLIKTLLSDGNITNVNGISFKHKGRIIHTPDRRLIKNLDTLPYPAYHLVEDYLKKYHFTMMAGKNVQFMVLEGSRGCSHKCRFCTQWKHWGGMWRTKSIKRIVDEMEYLNIEFGGQFLWFSDDNFEYSKRGKKLYQELRKRKFHEDIMLFFQARTDDVVNNPDIVGKLREVGNYWVMVGVESNSRSSLDEYNKNIQISDAEKAIKILNNNDIFSHAMFVIGNRKDTAKSIQSLRQFSIDLGSDFSIYTALTPFPGTPYYKIAMKNGWIEDDNFSNYDMAHAIMPTETLKREQVQEELYWCYKERYGSIAKGIAGIFSPKKLKRNLYRHYARERVLNKLRQLI